jgi:hypothetical protein
VCGYAVQPVLQNWGKYKDKVFQLQAWAGRWGSGRLRLRIFSTFGTMEVVRSSPSRIGRLYPQKVSWYSFLEAESTPGHMVPSVSSENIPSDTNGDRSRDPPTSSSVLLPLRYPMPSRTEACSSIRKREIHSVLLLELLLFFRLQNTSWPGRCVQVPGLVRPSRRKSPRGTHLDKWRSSETGRSQPLKNAGRSREGQFVNCKVLSCFTSFLFMVGWDYVLSHFRL